MSSFSYEQCIRATFLHFNTIFHAVNNIKSTKCHIAMSFMNSFLMISLFDIRNKITVP